MGVRQGLNVGRIVAAAAAVADRAGYDGLTLGAVAAELGVRPPSLYNHVAGLDELRRLVTIDAVRQLGAVIQRAAVGRSSAEAIRAIATAQRDFAHRHPGLYVATVPSSEGDDAEIQRTGAEVLEILLAVLEGLDLEGDEAIHAARALRSGVHGFVSLELAGGFGLAQSPETSFAALVDMLIEGIQTRLAATPSNGRARKA